MLLEGKLKLWDQITGFRITFTRNSFYSSHKGCEKKVIGVSKEKLKQKARQQSSGKNLKLVQILNGMLGFPTDKVVFKLDGKEIELDGIFDFLKIESK